MGCNMKIGIDIDGVISDFVKSFIKIVKKKYNLDLREQDIYVHDLFLVLGITEEEAGELIHETLTQDLDLIPGAKKSLNQLKREHEIYLLTARTEDLINITKNWLKRKGIPYDKLLHLREGLKHQADLKLDIIVEDNLKDAIRWLRKSKIVIIFDHPWNRSFNVRKLFRRAYNWQEIVEVVKEISLEKSES